MSQLDPSSQGFDREQPTSTPLRFRHTTRKRTPLRKKLLSAVRHSPLLLILLGVGLLGVLGWGFVLVWTEIKPTLLVAQQARTAAAATPTAPTTIAAATPTPKPVATSTPVPATPPPTPVATPSPVAASVETPRVNVTAPGGQETGRLTLQIGAFQNQAEAEEHLARMKSRGLDARIKTVVLPGKGTWHRVHVGRFSSRLAATQLGLELQALKTITGFVVTDY